MIVEVFGGAGGLAEGFRRAGIKIGIAFDRDLDACASYERNIGAAPVQLDVRDLERMARDGWSPGPIALLIADPPCATWSRAGKRRGLSDERDMLVTTCELVRHLRPAAWLIGNIPGLDDGPNIAALRSTIGALSRLGYCVDYANLDAVNYGVPQIRRRPFWYGHAGGPCIRWPRPTHMATEIGRRALALPGFMQLRPWVTCRDALGHLPPDELGRQVKLRKPTRPRSRRLLTRHDIPQGERIGTADAPAPTLSAKPGRAGVGESMLEWPWDRPSTTVTARAGLAPPGHHDESFAVMSLPDAIILSERAAALLQGFPETWVFCGKTKASRWGQIGMAVPPPLAEAIARSVGEAIHRIPM